MSVEGEAAVEEVEQSEAFGGCQLKEGRGRDE